MGTLQITKQNASAAYAAADANTKKVLEALLGKENILPQKITDRVKTFDDVLRISGKTMADLQSIGDTPDEVAYKQAKLIAKVYNEGEELDAYNTNQYKYFPWHKVSGSGLSCFGFVCWDSNSVVGVRLCFKNEQHAIDAGKKFIDIYTILKTK